MNEIDMLGKQVNALLASDDRIDELAAVGKLSADERKAWKSENRAKRIRLESRIETLAETGSGATPVLSPEQAGKLREAVRKLQVQILSEKAVRDLLGEALTIAETVAEAGVPTAEASSAAVAPPPAPAMAVPRGALLAFAVGLATGLAAMAFARARGRRER